MKETVAILCGGGPAPGMNTVVGSIAKIFLQNGYRVLGLHKGYQNLFKADAKYIDIDFEVADRIFHRGGSSLIMSRYKPKDSEFNTDFFTKHNIKLLVTVGGDDTASTANRIAAYLKANNLEVSNIHVPKTIDNDLPLPANIPTFGYNTAKHKGVCIAQTIYEDARTSNNWFVICAMGRSAGHLAFGIGEACHYPMVIIPEMFNKVTITVDKIVNMVVSSILKRMVLGIEYGGAIISEGVFHALDAEELKKTGITFTYDDHGHPELGKISKSTMFTQLIEKKLEELNLCVKVRPIEVGYETRTVDPIGFDLSYCTHLGFGVYKLFKENHTGCMVCVDHQGNVSPIFLSDLEDSNKKIPPRLVDMESESIQSVVKYNLHYIGESDYEQARKYVPNPEQFDFSKILN